MVAAFPQVYSHTRWWSAFYAALCKCRDVTQVKFKFFLHKNCRNRLNCRNLIITLLYPILLKKKISLFYNPFSFFMQLYFHALYSFLCLGLQGFTILVDASRVIFIVNWYLKNKTKLYKRWRDKIGCLHKSELVTEGAVRDMLAEYIIYDIGFGKCHCWIYLNWIAVKDHHSYLKGRVLFRLPCK